MNTTSPYNVLNQKKPISHISFLIFSLLVALFMSITGQKNTEIFPVGLFIMLFLQLEIFIFLGTKLFADLSFEGSPGEITRIVVIRFMIFLSGCLFFSMIIFILLQYAGLVISGKDISTVLSDFIHSGFGLWFRSTIKGLFLGAIIFVILLWQTSLRREQKLREEKLIFQNETLKSQINPHFLFNSLNTLSSLVVTRPEVAEEFINRLSAIYRYIIEYSSRETVPLETEIAFIRNYFFLHEIRDDGKIQLKVNIDDQVKFKILPVSLQILVENAVKHNKATRELPLRISIYLENKQVVVSNNLQKMSAVIYSTHTGLRNLGERIRLVTGKALIIEEKHDEFVVKIPLVQ